MATLQSGNSPGTRIAQAWETAFSGLKRGARAAEDDGAKGLYAALFERKAPARPKKKAPAKAPAAAGAP